MKRLFAAMLLVASCTDDLELFTWPGDDAGRPRPDASVVPENDAGLPMPSGPLTLGSAFEHTCAVRGGALFCWGDNSEGQLGLGHTDVVTTPARVALDSVAQVCAGESHTCALDDDGRLFCWGKNTHGELGVGDFTARTAPAEVAAPRIARIACGGYGTCAIGSTGALYCWGDNFEGKVGQNDPFTSPDVTLPTRVTPALEFRDVSVGQGHVCAVTREGTLYCWGRNSDGQLGLGSDLTQVRTPTQVGSARDHRAVAAGQRHTCALRGSGNLFCWGIDSTGSLGLGALPETRVNEPTQVMGEQGYRSLRASWFHTCALRGEGELWCWGRNEEGQLGLGDVQSRSVPTRVTGVFDQVTTGHFHGCGVRGEDLFCWGENDARNQLGLGAPGRTTTPTLVTFP